VLVAVEGPSQSGKTTLIKKLQWDLERFHDIPILIVHEDESPPPHIRPAQVDWWYASRGLSRFRELWNDDPSDQSDPMPERIVFADRYYASLSALSHPESNARQWLPLIRTWLPKPRVAILLQDAQTYFRGTEQPRLHDGVKSFSTEHWIYPFRPDYEPILHRLLEVYNNRMQARKMRRARASR
jgi:hypothetical protein